MKPRGDTGHRGLPGLSVTIFLLTRVFVEGKSRMGVLGRNVAKNSCGVEIC